MDRGVTYWKLARDLFAVSGLALLCGSGPLGGLVLLGALGVAVAAAFIALDD